MQGGIRNASKNCLSSRSSERRCAETQRQVGNNPCDRDHPPARLVTWEKSQHKLGKQWWQSKVSIAQNINNQSYSVTFTGMKAILLQVPPCVLGWHCSMCTEVLLVTRCPQGRPRSSWCLQQPGLSLTSPHPGRALRKSSARRLFDNPRFVCKGRESKPVRRHHIAKRKTVD